MNLTDTWVRDAVHKREPTRLVCFLAAMIVGLAVFLFHLPFANGSLLFDDAADYARAAQSPLMATWMNRDSASPLELIHRRAQPEFRAHPWDALYQAGDNAAQRHFHVPLSFFALHLADRSPGAEQAQRMLWCFVSALACAALAWVLMKRLVPIPAALLFALFAGVQSRFVEPSVDPSPHAFYILFAVLFLHMAASFFGTHRARDLYAAAIAFALAFASLEFSMELLFCVLVALPALWWQRVRPLPKVRELWPALPRAAALFFLVTFVVWPGGWLRGGYLECYGVLSATVLLKNRSAFGEKLTAGLLYHSLFQHHIGLLLVTLLSVVITLWLFAKRTLSAASVVFATYTLLALGLGLADRFRLNTYVSEFLFFLLATAGLVFFDVLRALHTSPLPRRASIAGVLTAVVSVLLFLGCVSEWRGRYDSISYRPWLAPVFAALRQQVPTGSRVLANDNLEALRLYVPQLRFVPTRDRSLAAPRVEARDAAVQWLLLDNGVAAPAGAEPLVTLPTTVGHAKTLYRQR